MKNATISYSDIEDLIWECEMEYDRQRYKRIGDLSDYLSDLADTSTMLGNGVSWADFM